MSMYLKPLGMYAYLATTKESYIVNGNYLEANTKSVHALKITLNGDYLFRVSNFDSAFAVWNTLISLSEQMPNNKERIG